MTTLSYQKAYSIPFVGNHMTFTGGNNLFGSVSFYTVHKITFKARFDALLHRRLAWHVSSAVKAGYQTMSSTFDVTLVPG
jgi:hypothetical protein